MRHYTSNKELTLISSFFFFQAEDGIRDLTVTGVQTCALPILSLEAAAVTIRGFLFADVFGTCSNSKLTVDTAYPRAQKCSPVKFRSLPHKRAIAMALFPFRNPITEATGYFGGIAMHMCTGPAAGVPP